MSAIITTNLVDMMTNDTSPNATEYTSEEKKQRIADLSYFKAHLDILAVGLTIAFLGYSLIQLRKKQK
jgi:hypothetical protein